MKLYELLGETKIPSKLDLRARLKGSFGTETSVIKSSELTRPSDPIDVKLDRLSKAPTSRRGFMRAASIMPRASGDMLRGASVVHQVVKTVGPTVSKSRGNGLKLLLGYLAKLFIPISQNQPVPSFDDFDDFDDLFEYAEENGTFVEMYVAAKKLGVDNLNKLMYVSAESHTVLDDDTGDENFETLEDLFQEVDNVHVPLPNGSTLEHTFLGKLRGVDCVRIDEQHATSYVVRRSDF